MVERQQKPKRSDTSPDQGSKLYQLQDQEDIKVYQQDKFFEEILKQGKSTKSKGKRLVIIGEPGAGKTTLLQKISFWILEHTSELPFFIFLRELKGKSLEEYLFDKWLKYLTKRITVDDHLKKDFECLFTSKRIWLLLDGVDEIGRETASILAEIKEQLIGLLGEIKIIITCRTNFWDAGSNSLHEFDAFKSLDFSYGDSQFPDQVNLFIKNWFSNTPNPGIKLRQELDKPGKERIKDLAKNPLRLALLCRSWQLRQKLPNTKALLYKRFIEAIYEWRKAQYSIEEDQRDTLTEWLGRLAIQALNQESNRFCLKFNFIEQRIKEIKKDGLAIGKKTFDLAKDIGLLNHIGVAEEDPEEDVYAFIHPTFQEYFAAQSINDWYYFFTHDADKPQLGSYRIFDNTWKEVVLLWLGRDDIAPKEKEAFFQALGNFEDSCGGGYKARAKFLLAVGSTEFKDFGDSEQVIKEIVNWGFESIKKEYFPESFRKSASGVLLEIDKTKATNILTNFIENSLHLGIIKEAVTRLKEIHSGSFIEDLFTTLLSENIYSSPLYYRIANVFWGMDPDNKKAINAFEKLCDSENEETSHNIAGQLLFRFRDNEKAINTLLTLLRSSKNEDTIRWSIHHLRVIDNPPRQDVINALINVLRCSHNRDHIMSAALFLESMIDDNRQAIDALEDIVKTSMNWDTIDLVGNLLMEVEPNNKIILNKLEELLDLYQQNEEWLFRVASKLGWNDPNNSKAVNVLFSLLSTQKDYIESWVCTKLSELAPKSSLVVNKLISLANSSSSEKIYKQFVDSLMGINACESNLIETLNKVLKSSNNEKTVYKTALILIRLSKDSDDAKVILLNITKSNTSTVGIRTEAIRNLKGLKLSENEQVEILKTFMKEQQEEICCCAAEVLAKIQMGKGTGTDNLIQWLDSSQPKLVLEAITTLDKLKLEEKEVGYASIKLLKKIVETKATGEKVEQENKIIEKAISVFKTATKDKNIKEFYFDLITLLKNISTQSENIAISQILNKNLDKNYLSELVAGIKGCVTSLFADKYSGTHRNCYEIYWYCVQNMSYPEFYKAWNR